MDIFCIVAARFGFMCPMTHFYSEWLRKTFMQAMSSSGSGTSTTYIFFIFVAMAYHASLWCTSMPKDFSGASSVPRSIFFNNNLDIQSSVGSISQTRQSLGQDVLIVELESLAENVHFSNDIEITAEIRCLAMNIYFEARSESVQGQLAVGHVVMNRVSDAKFPNTVCKVIHQGGQKRRNRCQFSWWCDGKDDVPRNKQSWRASVRLAHEINNGWTTDPTGGALWYHATYVKPYWRRAFAVGPEIGRHIFYSHA